MLISCDEHRYCHTREGSSCALQAEEQATGSFIERPGNGQRGNASKFNQSSNSCVPTIRYNSVHNCVQAMGFN
jgi:hypothetical protein